MLMTRDPHVRIADGHAISRQQQLRVVQLRKLQVFGSLQDNHHELIVQARYHPALRHILLLLAIVHAPNLWVPVLALGSTGAQLPQAVLTVHEPIAFVPRTHRRPLTTAHAVPQAVGELAAVDPGVVLHVLRGHGAHHSVAVRLATQPLPTEGPSIRPNHLADALGVSVLQLATVERAIWQLQLLVASDEVTLLVRQRLHPQIVDLLLLRASVHEVLLLQPLYLCLLPQLLLAELHHKRSAQANHHQEHNDERYSPSRHAFLQALNDRRASGGAERCRGGCGWRQVQRYPHRLSHQDHIRRRASHRPQVRKDSEAQLL
mmetsp:Transcript_75235/g.179610  ORF Transcript_75235/g.179610 Transcript_75235/m.179610 type:complete len:318 (+) Transcript_75235:747-1700(+)